MHLYFKPDRLKKMTVLPVIFFSIIGCDSSNVSRYENIDDLSFYNDAVRNLPLDGMPDNNAYSVRKPKELNFSPKYLSRESSVVDMQHYEIPNDKKSDFYNIVKTPESKPDYIAIAISFLALLASVLVPIHLQRKQKKDAIHDGFWLREVIFPKINELMFKICSDLKDSFNMNNSDFSNFYQDTISIKIEELHETFSILNSFPNMQTSISALENICDELDNNIDNHQLDPLQTRILDVTEFNTKLIKELVQIHKKI
ncbi:Uncharacterised protein [Klebsiella pneumoniae]|nr:hypothetical protein [Enterobacter sp. JUb54]QNK09434.1 hypothetical protein HF679_08370 [Enterobacter sp. JUb54]SVJ85885.1 Uncharacterised protein [Klebsiella pneumoniae]